MFFTLELFPRKNVLDWLKKTLLEYPQHFIITSTHAFINENGQAEDVASLKMLNFLKGLDRSILLFSGSSENNKQKSTYSKRIDYTKSNKKIISIMSNVIEGDIRLVKFHLDWKEIKIQTYSILKNKNIMNKDNDFSITL